MDEADEQGNMTPMMMSAVLLHENFTCLVEAGFNEDQACFLLGQWILGREQHG